ncbi:MAG: S8 family serine peptidase [Anaerolineae bacterium]|nr:S8 family serine peptidase [Anaerolineae bacterium]
MPRLFCRWWLWLLIAPLLAVGIARALPLAFADPFPATPQPLSCDQRPETCAWVDPALARALAQADPNDILPAIIILREQAEPQQAIRLATSPEQARAHLVADLIALAERSQTSLRAYLESERAAGRVESYTPFWIFNGLAVRARPETLRALAARPEVALLRLDRYQQYLLSSPGGERGGDAAGGWEWNLTRIRAPEVWATLGISGTGAVVASMDTGVDWLHPALQANYRGYNPHGPAWHRGNWYDPATGSLYPIDDHGHGTHTLGTAVGREGLGVAPGARWIAVKMLDRHGYGYDSWIHAGFQWLLAPAGDPTLAPDVVNCSWGDENGFSTEFQQDLRALRAVGIFVVFANGNSGPRPGTVVSPASLPEAFAVGATDSGDRVAYFSSRGPSPWGEVRPHVVAPGVEVRSALPGGIYGTMSGTSMATPHVAGLVALLRAVSPTLDITRTAFLITSTAVPLSTTIPNNDSGWGRIDAFAAVSALMNAGLVRGTVSRWGDGAPISGATVVATFHGNGGGGAATTDVAGRYTLPLAPGPYDLTARAFGYVPATRYGIVISPGSMITVDFSLMALPTGTLRVALADGATGAPVTATLTVLNTPLTATASLAIFTLPAGDYTLRARGVGYRVVTATTSVTIGTTTALTLTLPRAPSVLLVDSGAWYYGSQIPYYRQALDDLALAYDEWAVRQIPDDVPTADLLAPYDVVVWSAPYDAPGYIGAQNAITTYLSSGGRLFLSGQDVGFLDAGMPYYWKYLKARLVEDSSNLWTVEGLPGGLFAGLTMTIAGPGGANNQYYPDVVAPHDPNAVAPVLAYTTCERARSETECSPTQVPAEGGCPLNGHAALATGTCLDYRVLYLSFGFEAITERETRRELMRRALDWLTAPTPDVGLEVQAGAGVAPWPAHTAVGPPGTVVTHTLRVRNTGRGSIPDVVVPSVVGAEWPIRLSAPYLVLPACTSATLTVSVTVPVTAAWDARDVFTLTLRSVLSPSLTATVVLTAKAPAPVLLVDDDRWYEQAPKYRAAMEAIGIPYDLWETHVAIGSGGRGSPPLEVLRWYPVVIWWTGYDWYEPVTPGEEATLVEYLEGGGRLFLTAQDFLYYHAGGPLQPFLGVLTHTEDISPTAAVVVSENPAGLEQACRPSPTCTWLLHYPFRNWSDGLIPSPNAVVLLRDKNRRAIGLARRGVLCREAQSAGECRPSATVFFSFPWESLPGEVRPEVLRQVVGYLSWLGGSSFQADRGAAAPGARLTHTLWLVNDGPVPVTAAVSTTFPADQGTAPPLAWSGVLAPGAGLTFTLPVMLAEGLPPGTVVPHTARIALLEQGVVFSRTVWVRVGMPDLGPSVLTCGPSPAEPGTPVTCTLRLENAGPADAPSVTAEISGPMGLLGVLWSGPLPASRALTLTRAVTPTVGIQYVVAFLEDGMEGRWERAAWVKVRPWRAYLPVLMKSLQKR